MQQNQIQFLDLLNILNLGLQVYNIGISKDEIDDTGSRLKRIEEKQDRIIKLLEEHGIH